MDFNDTVERSIKPTKSSFWKIQDLIVASGTHVYYSYYGTLDKSFRYGFEANGSFTFAVPNVYIPVPNTTLNLSVSTPN